MVQFRRHSYDSSVVKKTIAALLEANCPAQGYPRHLSEAGGPDTAIIVTLHQPHASYCPDLVSSASRFVTTEKAPTRAFSWLKAATTAFTFKTLLRHYAERVLTPRSLNVK